MYLLCVSADPLEHVGQMYRENLLDKALFLLMTPEKRKLDGPSQTAEVLLYTQLLADSAAMKTKHVSISPAGLSCISGKRHSNKTCT